MANALKEANVKSDEERRRAVQTFQYFIKEFREKIDSPELEIRDLAMGIRGYGIFANVSGCWEGQYERAEFCRRVSCTGRTRMSNSCSSD